MSEIWVLVKPATKEQSEHVLTTNKSSKKEALEHKIFLMKKYPDTEFCKYEPVKYVRADDD